MQQDPGKLINCSQGIFVTYANAARMLECAPVIPTNQETSETTRITEYCEGVTRLRMIDVHQKHIWPLGKKPLKGARQLRTAVNQVHEPQQQTG